MVFAIRSIQISRWVVSAVIIMAAMQSSLLTAQPLAIPKYVSGTHYQLLDKPFKVAADDKIEVMEVFWYGCSHCYSFEPYVQNWKLSIAEDVEFMRTPASWAKQMEAHAALYYVTEILDLPPEIHNDLFVLLTKERRLEDEKRFAEVFAAFGVSEEDFLKAYNSFGVKSKVKQAKNRTQKHYATQGTPEVVVNGKYRVSASMAGGAQELLAVVDHLIGLERQQ